MQTHRRFECWMRWAGILAVGVLPAFVMRCDKAALNFQRGLYEGLGDSLSELLVEGFARDDSAGGTE